ncbi:MAG TPA: tetratricopeptide repeat protein [Chthoniobacterales bacterium]|nr:tetratricopeptide repeat protein [Chthoniobacterales bacterium]
MAYEHLARAESVRARSTITMPTAPSTTTESSVEARVFWLRFQKEIAAALIVVLLTMVGYVGYRFYVNRRDTKAAELLGGAKTQADYDAVIARYPTAPAGASAYLLLAQRQREEKKFAEANATLQKFVESNPDHDFVPTARLAMAANLEALGKDDEALAIYQQVAGKYGNTYCGPLAFISQVPILKAKNRIQDARRVCEEIVTKYRMPGQQSESASDTRMETVWVGQAMQELRTLKSPEEPKPAPPSLSLAPNAPPPMLAAPSAAPGGPPKPGSGAPTPQKPK